MAWIDDHNAEVLTRFRAQFTDMEWSIFRAGRCCWVVAYGVGRIDHCGESRQQRHIYCLCHTENILRDYRGQSGDVLVPQSVSALGTDLPE